MKENTDFRRCRYRSSVLQSFSVLRHNFVILLPFFVAKKPSSEYQSDMPLIDMLKYWFERDLRFVNWADAQIVCDRPKVAQLRFSTPRFAYSVHVDTEEGINYLGSTCFERESGRRHHLSNGTISEETWLDIVQDITDMEIIPTRPSRGR